MPTVLASDEPDVVTWSLLWPHRPNIRIRFELASDGASGTSLRWVLRADPPGPDASALGHLRKRVNELINGDLRHAFGQ